MSTRAIAGNATRRDVLTAAAALSLVGNGAMPVTDTRTGADGIVKLQADLDTKRTTPWWYEVAIYAVVGDAPPLLFLRGEGCETYRMQREDDGGYRATLATLSLFKHTVDDRWLDRVRNPVTGRDGEIRPNVITDSIVAFPRDGSVPLPVAPAGTSTPVGWLRWLDGGDRIGCTMERRSTGPFQPLGETSSLWTDRAGFLDPATTRAEAVFASTYVSPWFRWMAMAGRPGHLLWHASGRKLHAIDELPAGYRRRAEQIAPGFLAAHG